MKTSRRRFLEGFGGALITLPVLEANGWAAGPRANAHRFVAFGLWDGVIPDEWFPTGNETSFTLASMMKPLERHRADLIALKGVDNAVAMSHPKKNGHMEGATTFLTPWLATDQPAGSNSWVLPAEATSADQLIADELAKQGVLTRFPSLPMGNQGGSYGTISYRNGKDAGLNGDPKRLYSLLFQNPGQSAEATTRARALRKSVLDGALADFDRVSKQLSGEDQRRVQQHLEALRDVEKRLDTPPPVACDPNAWTAPTATDKGTLWTSLVDIAALAMACDTTRVVTFSFDHAGGGGPALPWIGVNDDMHEISHRIVGAKPDSADYQSFIKLRVWFTELVAHFVDTLKKVTLPNGESLFDDTVVFTGSEISFNHSTPDMPYVILAGAQTPFRTGRFVQVGPKVSHSNLLVTLLHAFGSQASAIGLPQFSTGNLDAALFKA